jgi:DNA replication initiation complex subunit (GINS family)
MEGKVLLHWRVFFRTLFENIESDSQLQSAFEKLSENKDLHKLKKDIKFFLMRKVGPWLASKSCNPGLTDKEQDLLSSLLTKCNKAEKFLK